MIWGSDPVPMEEPKRPVYVWWKEGIWKVILVPKRGEDFLVRKIRLRWVWGPRPDKGLFHDVRVREVQTLNEMEIIAMMTIPEITP